MKIFSVLTLVLLALNLPLQAKVELPEQICSHMVIQQQTKAKLWGWARNGAKIDVTVSWNKEIYTTKADKTGRWEVFIDTPAASFVPQQLTISDGEPIVLVNIETKYVILLLKSRNVLHHRIRLKDHGKSVHLKMQ